MAKKVERDIADVHSELMAVKKLLILQLLNSGVTGKQIAATLGIDQGNLSRMVPAKLGRKRA
jgi:hypothetical protein